MSVMIGSCVKDAETWLPRFLHQLDKFEDPVSRIVFLYGESKDRTFSVLDHWRNITKHKVEIYSDPYMPIPERQGYTLARLKQELQRIFKRGDEDYFLSLDADLMQIPTDTIGRLMGDGVDVVSPMVWTEKRYTRTFFDTYEFRKNGCMFHPYNPPGMNENEPFPVDSAGNCCLLFTREAIIAAVYSNPYPNIPMCKRLKEQGFEVWVDPRVNVYHVDLEHYGIMHYPPPIPYSTVPYITADGEKLVASQVGAAHHQVDVDEYNRWFTENLPKEKRMIDGWWNKRPLITASYRVFNEGKFLKYSLDSVYPYVDRIDIAEGAIEKLRGYSSFSGSSTDDTLQIIENYPDPKHKIRLIRHHWQSKDHMQHHLWQVCQGQWMLLIDGDEIVDNMKAARKFCSEHTDGSMVHARFERFYSFWHDFHHIAYSLNPLSPWAQFGMIHGFLIWMGLPGLSFAATHSFPIDGIGRPLHVDNPKYRKRQGFLDGVFVYHFGEAKGRERIDLKVAEGVMKQKGDEPWFTGVMPPDMVIERFDAEKLPASLRKHPDYNKHEIEITATKPVYKFRLLK
jgi:hypothetical protein